MASHEFRTPLTAILSSAGLAERYNEPDQTEKRLKHLKRIKGSVAHLTSVLNDFLSLSKLESGKAEYVKVKVNLNEYIKDLLDDLRLICKEGQEINYAHKGENDIVEIDTHVMRNIVFNLVSNAIKYSPNGEEIDFLTELTPNQLIISVLDHGIGIPEVDQEKIFEKFFRAGNSGSIQGTGLGLNIVSKYVQLANGEISFTSKLNEGSTFTVILPQNNHV